MASQRGDYYQGLYLGKLDEKGGERIIVNFRFPEKNTTENQHGGLKIPFPAEIISSKISSAQNSKISSLRLMVKWSQQQPPSKNHSPWNLNSLLMLNLCKSQKCLKGRKISATELLGRPQ